MIIYSKEKTHIDFYNDANAFYDLKEYQKSLSILEISISLNPSFLYAYELRGILHSNIKKFDDAILDFNKAYELSTDIIDKMRIISNRAIAYNFKGLHTKAISDFTEIINFDNKNYKAFLGRGLAYFDSGEFTKSIEDNLQALKLNPNNVFAYNNIATSYDRLKQKDLALYYFFKALIINADNELVLYNIACLYSEIKEIKKSILYLDKAINAGWNNIEHINSNKSFDNIKDLKEFKELIKKIK